MTTFLRPTSGKRVAFFLSGDIILSLITLYGAYLLRFNFDIPPEFLEPFASIALTLIALKLLFIYFFKNYNVIWRFYSLAEAKKLFFALMGTYLLFALIHAAEPGLFTPFPRSVVIIDLILSMIFLGGLRLLKRLVLDFGSPHADFKATLIVGISQSTHTLIKSALEGSSPYYPVGIVAVQAKNRNMIGSTVHNLRIIGSEHLRDAVASQKITAAIIDGSLPVEQLRECYRLLSEEGISDIKRSALLSDGAETITPLSIEELLARHPKDLDTQTIESFIRGKKVLITGAGGSIGSEIALQCRRFGASELILIDNSEYNLYQIGERLPGAALHLCSVTDRAALDDILSAASPDILIHAAAYKHVPLCEANPHAAVVNNVIGSRNVIDSAIANSVSKIVIISTDKAVRPTNVMGATKRIVELYAQNVDPRNSEIVSVRFGNVLGSSGSVIPKFKSQIETGGPVTITHPEITRYFMLISEACQLVLQAAAIARGGELFILDMGEPVRIQTLAETMIRLYATRPVKIVYTGLRPGEKLYEELLIDESEQKTAFESIMIARPTPCDISSLNTQID
ncbi:MAG: polysaccharide biosynthesis protein, partial [Campylobacterales bacterium]|nr:polysaccharide biosynthesis protein [Campylobacterales bacterium]